MSAWCDYGWLRSKGARHNDTVPIGYSDTIGIRKSVAVTRKLPTVSLYPITCIKRSGIQKCVNVGCLLSHCKRWRLSPQCSGTIQAFSEKFTKNTNSCFFVLKFSRIMFLHYVPPVSLNLVAPLTIFPFPVQYPFLLILFARAPNLSLFLSNVDTWWVLQDDGCFNRKYFTIFYLSLPFKQI